jgi:hypothetical protein
MTVPYESGPNGGFVHPFTLLAQAGYPVAQALPPAVTHAASTGRALVGIAGTAMSQLADMQAGRQSQFVIFDLTARHPSAR